MLIDRLEVPPLVDAFRRDLPSAGRARRPSCEVLLQLDVRILCHELGGCLHIAALKTMAATKERRELLEHALSAAHVLRGALDDDVVAARFQADVQRGFKMPKVFVE